MAFDYDKLKQKDDGTQWTSYSDLFMVLSVVFLLLYVVSSLRNGTYGIQKYVEYNNLQKENEDLKQQIQVYNNLKENYLETKASKNELNTYNELMGQLELLQDDAKVEKEKLRLKAFQNEKKEKALNKYQQIVRNIINSNMLAQERIKKRDKKITKRNREISKQNREIASQNIEIEKQTAEIEKQSADLAKKKKIIALKKKIIAKNKIVLKKKEKEIKYLARTVRKKKRIIAKNKQEIRSVNTTLNDQLNKLAYAYKKQKMTKKKYKQKLAFIKKKSKRKITKLKKSNQNIQRQLGNTNQQLKLASNQLNKTNKKIKKQRIERKKLSKEMTKLNKQYRQQLHDKDTQWQQKLAKVDKEYQTRLQRLRTKREADIAQFEKVRKMSKVKFNKIREMDKAQFKKLRSKDKNAYKNQLALEQKQRQKELQEYFTSIREEKNRASKLRKQYSKTLKKEKGRYTASIKNLSADLQKAKKLMSARKQIVGAIKKNFRKAGIPVTIDKKTGDVILSFKDEYFDTNRAHLKPKMRGQLEKFFPLYSKSIFSNKKISEMIASVEIVGFASATYKGRYIDPKSLDIRDQKAVDYNMQLSFKRANSIFKYIFNTKRMKYKFQRSMRPMVKVTGRSFLADGVKNTNIAKSLTIKQYCKRYDCKKSQKVIIRFNLKD